MLGIILNDSNFINAEFIDCNMKEAQISNITFKNIDFNKCDLTESNFSKTSMNGLDLRSCDISGIVSYLEDIKGVILTSEQSLTFIKLLGITIID